MNNRKYRNNNRNYLERGEVITVRLGGEIRTVTNTQTCRDQICWRNVLSHSLLTSRDRDSVSLDILETYVKFLNLRSQPCPWLVLTQILMRKYHDVIGYYPSSYQHYLHLIVNTVLSTATNQVEFRCQLKISKSWRPGRDCEDYEWRGTSFGKFGTDSLLSRQAPPLDL